MAGDPHALVGFCLCFVLLTLVLIPFARTPSARPARPGAAQIPPADNRVPTTLGWRSWIWDEENRVLVSPTRRTPWLDPELHCDDWDTSEAIRGATGIHAHLVPVRWEEAESEYAGWLARTPALGAAGSAASMSSASTITQSIERPRAPPIVTGIVERFGRYVLGTEGWRAEWVIVRKLRAPTPEIAEALARVYPDVEIIHGNRQAC